MRDYTVDSQSTLNEFSRHHRSRYRYQSPISPRPFAVRPRQMEPESAPLEFLKEPPLSLDPSQKVRQTPKIQLEEVVRIVFTRCGGELVD